MSENISRINHISPAYPVKKIEPATKERGTGQRKRDMDRRSQDEHDDNDVSDESSEHKIDEYV